MATDEPTPPEGFGEFEPETSDDTDGIETVDLSPGESLSGMVLNVTEGENDNGPWVRLKLKDDNHGVCVYFAKGDVKRAFYEDRINEGEPIWIAKRTEEETFTPDGEDDAVSFYPTVVAFPESDD